VAAYPNPTGYTPTSNASNESAWADGFPVITNWDDPILYSCQKNFILGIGDIHTHDDGDLPGGSPFASNEPSPALATPGTAGGLNDTLDVQVLTNYVASLENAETSTSNSAGDNLNGNASEPIPLKYVGGDQNTYYMAGIAYGAHTQDLRPTEYVVNGQKSSIQTVTTYWMDVLESRDYQWRNAFWLAAKYGGFTVPSTWVTSNTSIPLTQMSWNANNRTDASLGGSGKPMPDNYYDASHADTMVSGLSSAFQSISSSLKAYTTSFSLSSPNISISNSIAYSAQYDSSVWRGDVYGQLVTGFDPVTGAPQYGAGWDADALASALTPSSRNIITCCRLAQTAAPNLGIQFNQTSMTAYNPTELALLASAAPLATPNQVLTWLTGDHSKEVVNGGLLRNRLKGAAPFVTGDIVDSAVLANGPPSAIYSDAYNPGYAAFKTLYANRNPAIFVGANDGMLHAYDGTVTAVNGSSPGAELFAYIPSATFHGPTAPTVDGLASLVNPNFVHHYFVDQTPVIEDVDFTMTTAAFGALPGSGAANWHSVLIGGMGKGGRSYFAIDVTTPTSVGPSQVLWEFTDSDMGYTFGPAVIVKTKKYGWVAILTSGYNNTTSGDAGSGQGFFYFVNPATGVLLEKVPTNSGTPSAPSGLGPAAAFVNDYTNGTADAVYAGDLQGNVWRVDLTGTSQGVAYPAALNFAQLRTVTGGSTGQPITIRPLIEVVPGSDARRVLIGTGELLSTVDISNSDNQSFYSILDGNSTTFSTAATLPSGVSFPITRANLHPLTQAELLTGESSSVLCNGASPCKPEGFFLDLGPSSGATYRINVPMVEDQGVVVFAANLPVGDACNPTGTNEIYALDINNGQSDLLASDGKTIVPVFSGLSNIATSVSLYVQSGTSSSSGSGSGSGSGTGTGGGTTASGPGTQGIGCNSVNGCENIRIKPVGGGGFQKLNWRELPSAN
jgi:type IV pilus assembly protein PilY1